MRRALIAFVLVSLVTPAFCLADKSKDIKKAESLIKDRQYMSAFEVLQEADPDNASADVAMVKSDIVIKYFLHSINCRMFSLKDLEPSESVEQLRGKSGTSRMVIFDPGEVLGTLVKKHPENWKLHKSIGDYFDFVSECGPNSLEGIDPVERSIEHYSLAYENGVYDWESVFSLGLYELKAKKYDRAITYLEKSIELNEDYAASHYDLAYAYIHVNKHDKAMEHAVRAYGLYETPSLRGDAARMAASISGESSDEKSALEYYELSDRADPGNFYTLKAIIPLYLKNKKTKAAALKAKELFNLEPRNPATAQALLQAYLDHPDESAALNVLEALAREHRGNDEILGSVYFHKAQYLAFIKRKEESTKVVVKARGHFSKVFEKDHPVFNLIEEIISDNGK